MVLMVGNFCGAPGKMLGELHLTGPGGFGVIREGPLYTKEPVWFH